MDEDGGEDLSSPFWMPTSSKRRPIRHAISSLFFNSGLLILLLLITALTFLVFVLPSTLTFSAQIFKPTSVKKSWDSLNLLLVFFALLFGFLCRNKNDQDSIPDDEFQDSPVNQNEYTNNEASSLQSPKKWFHYSDHNRMLSSRDGFMRTSTSYPDLRQVSSQMEFSDDPWRFSDDINWATGTGQFLRRRSWKNNKSDDVTGQWTPDTRQRLPGWKEKIDDDGAGVKSDNIPVVISSRGVEALQPVNLITSPSLIPTPPVLPLRSPLPEMTSALPEEKPVVLNRHKRGRNRRKDIEMVDSVEPISPVVASSPPPQTPLPSQVVDLSKNKKKRSGGNATKEFLNSLYQNKKKKKQRQRSVENFDSLLEHQYQSPLQPPPPPPPPPFKRSTRKRSDAVISASSGPTPSQFLTVTMNLPPNAVTVSNYYGAEDSGNSGGESPIVRIPPPPPPPPPFAKSLKWKFALQGDYVRVDSLASSRSGSPDPDDTESDVTPMAGETTPLTASSSAFCPSPDVNSKAENFISNFWAGLKLEKINSMNKRDGLGLSNLGPGSGQNRK